MISNVIIIHGCAEDDKVKLERGDLPKNEKHWFLWIKKELKKRKVKVYVPVMPESWNPKYEKWKEVFEKLPVDENTVLVGHSAGGSFITRWLGESNKKIKKLVLVAPAIIHGDYWGFLKDLCSFTIDKSVKNKSEKIIIFVSDNESDGIKKAVDIYCDGLGIKSIELKGRGHFLYRHMKTHEFPELLQKILE